MKLYVVSPYKNRDVYYKAGQVLDVDEEEAKFLMTDSPGSFSKEEPKEEKKAKPKAAKAKKKPPQDKAVKSAENK